VKIKFRCYGELNNFLPSSKRKRLFILEIRKQNSIETVIDSIGVPLSKIDLILANGEPVGFGYLLQANDRISLYPAFRSIDISPFNLINQGSLH